MKYVVGMDDLASRLKEFELDGIELTDEDVASANGLVKKNGLSKDEAVARTLSDIRAVLDAGLGD